MLNGDTLARLYDLVIFGGHTEYVTPQGVRRRRALPRPRRQPDVPLREQLLLAGAAPGRDPDPRRASGATSGGPESALIGVQYRANDDGRHPAAVHRARRPTRRPGSSPAPISRTAPSSARSSAATGSRSTRRRRRARRARRCSRRSPSSTGPGFTAQMTYYETPAGREGVRRRRDRLRRHGAAARRLADAREPLGAPRRARSLAQTDRSSPSSTCCAWPTTCNRARFLTAGGALARCSRSRRALPSQRCGVRQLPLGSAARNVGRRYAGDRTLFATVSPGVPGRDAAAIRFRLPLRHREARGRPHGAANSEVVWETRRRLGRGEHAVALGSRAATARRLVRHAADDRASRADARRCSGAGARFGRAAEGARRPRARRRGGVPSPLVPPGRADGAPDHRRRTGADAPVSPLRRRDREHRAKRRARGRAERRPGADRLDGKALGPRDDHRSGRRLAARASTPPG